MTDGVRIVTIPRHDRVDAYTMAGIEYRAAVAHRILVIAWCIMRDDPTYPGASPKDLVREQKAASGLIRRLQTLTRTIAGQHAAPATADDCPRRGIACMHARNASSRTPASPSP